MNDREEFEIIKGFGQRKWDYNKMENYLKENKFFRGIWADEIGLHPGDDADRLVFNPFYMQLFQHGYAAGKTEQQKIIDELKAENFALSAMVCKHPDKRTLDENYDSSKDYCDALQYENKQLKAENKKLEKKIETFQESTKTYLDLLRKEGI